MSSLPRNKGLMAKLFAVTLGMFAFGYLLIPMYKAICDWTGVNILALSEREANGSMNGRAGLKNTQVDDSRTVTVENLSRSCLSFKTRKTGPCLLKPFRATPPFKRKHISTSWNAFASTSTP